MEQKFLDGNKLITEFMGFIPISEFDFLGYNHPYKEDSDEYKKLLVYDAAKYHSSFDSLMPVGLKCLEVAEDAMLDEWVGSIVDAAGNFIIEPLYNELVEFIKFYNNNPNEFNI